MGYANVRIGIIVERFDSKIIPFEYNMFHIRSCSDPMLVEWANEEVGLLIFRGVICPQSMKVGERRRYWVHMEMRSYQSWEGEWNSDIEFLSVKRA